MPRNKDLKRLVRNRMQKTGEAYTTARSHIIRKKPAAAGAEGQASESAMDLAKLAGMTDATMQEKTGRTWQQWVDLLDRVDAVKLPHRDIAVIVNETYEVDDWWAQCVTVGYERIKGLRKIGQRRDGTYEANKSRTYNVSVNRLFEAWSDAKLRKRWLNASGLKVRTETAPKSMRLGWEDGSIIAAGFTARGKGRSSVALSHTKLRDLESAERMKQYWTERLDALGELFDHK